MIAFKSEMRITLVLGIVFSGMVAHGQTAQVENPSHDALVISLEMQRERISIGQKPWAILTMENVNNHSVIIRDSMYRVHVEGKHGEPPTTLVQRQMTDRLRPGEAPLRGDEYAGPPTVEPHESCVRKFQLTYLYDLSVPGKYTVFAEVMDPSSHRWLRSRAATFEMTVAPQ